MKKENTTTESDIKSDKNFVDIVGMTEEQKIKEHNEILLKKMEQLQQLKQSKKSKKSKDLKRIKRINYYFIRCNNR